MLEQVHDNSFEKCSNVTTLNLANNHYISVIRDLVFKDMPKLEKIALNENRLEYNNTSFPDQPFKNLLHLKSLSLQSIQIGLVLTPDEFQAFLRKLPLTLEELFINFPCCFDGFAAMLTTFTKLQTLGVRDIGNLPVITDTTFEALRNLSITHLRLQLGNLLEVHPLAFSHFVNLKTLDMSDSQGLTIADLSSAWMGLQFTKIETLKLSFVLKNLLSTDLVILTGAFFKYLDFPNLVNLEMDSTKLNAIEYNFEKFTGLNNLKTLNLSNNFFSIYDLYYLTTLCSI